MPRKDIAAQEKSLDEEERQLIRELEAGEWISDPDSPHLLRFLARAPTDPPKSGRVKRYSPRITRYELIE